MTHIINYLYLHKYVVCNQYDTKNGKSFHFWINLCCCVRSDKKVCKAFYKIQSTLYRKTVTSCETYFIQTDPNTLFSYKDNFRYLHHLQPENGCGSFGGFHD